MEQVFKIQETEKYWKARVSDSRWKNPSNSQIEGKMCDATIWKSAPNKLSLKVSVFTSAGFKVRAKYSLVIKNGKIKKASLSVFRSKKNKPVDNYRTLKKAYARGGAEMVLRTVQHYNQMALK